MPQLWLTFDDGPDPVWTPRILDALRAAALRATFFVIAPRAQAHPTLVRRAQAEGHDVQLHLHPAPHLRFAEVALLSRDVSGARSHLDEALSVVPADEEPALGAWRDTIQDTQRALEKSLSARVGSICCTTFMRRWSRNCCRGSAWPTT